MSRVVRSALALDDLQGIWGYIATDNVVAADATIRKISDAFDTLANSPLLGEKYEGELRRFVIGTYLIFYRPIDDGIEVARVFHGARRYEELL